jgi:hypothetical protein
MPRGTLSGPSERKRVPTAQDPDTGPEIESKSRSAPGLHTVRLCSVKPRAIEDASAPHVRVSTIDAVRLQVELDAQGWALAPELLTAEECATMRALYKHEALFRSRVIMSKHGYGRGEYKYFRYPLPDPIAALRNELYALLLPIANRWQVALGRTERFPETHAAFVERCHEAGQLRPTPLLLSYAQGDYNCLHQDLYGEHVFPLQVALLLSEPARDFRGGELVLTEQRPRMQSRPMVVPVAQGDAVVFAVRERPVQGVRGTYRVNMRHGVSALLAGERMTLGIIFHDAT